MSRLVATIVLVCVSAPLRAQPIEDCPVSIECPDMSACTCTSEGNEVVVEIDQFADGRVDLRYRFELDEGGEVVLEELRLGQRLQFRSRYTRDDRGNVVREEHDQGGDGRIERVVLAGYDDSGNRTLRELDEGADGVIDRRTTSEYDAQGRLIEEALDREADGRVDLRATYGYDADGNRVLLEEDRTGDGEIDIRCTYSAPCRAPYETCDEVDCQQVSGLNLGALCPPGRCDFPVLCGCDRAGRVVAFEREVLGSRVRVHYGYDEAGRAVRIETDDGADGVIDRRQLQAFDDGDNVVRRQIDEGADGAIDEEVRFSYDQAGHVIRQETDRGADGQVDDVDRYVYEGGLLRLYEQDFDADDEADWCETYEYDGEGQVTVKNTDSQCDGQPDSRWTQTYTADGHPLVMGLDRGADGTIEEEIAHTYDASGNLVQVETRADALVMRCTYDPPCPPPFEDCPRACESGPRP